MSEEEELAEDDRRRFGANAAKDDAALGVTSSAGRTHRRSASLDGDRMRTLPDLRLVCSEGVHKVA